MLVLGPATSAPARPAVAPPLPCAARDSSSRAIHKVDRKLRAHCGHSKLYGTGGSRAAVSPPPRASASSGVWLTEVSALSDRAARALEASVSRAQAASSRAAEASSRDAAAAPQASLRLRLESAAAAMQAGLVERDAEVRLMLLAALGREHVLLVGPPGTAKSELGRRLSRLCSGPFFERMLTKFSVPEELFGPLSLQALERDEYVRRTEGYLPCAHVAFVDEIFKASSSILNTLLGMLHERAFDNGRGATHVPLVCLVAASNELPEAEELEALYDRFLVRRRVEPISREGLSSLLGSGSGAPPAQPARVAALLSREDLEGTRERALRGCSLPPRVVEILADLREHLVREREPPVFVSDRRLLKAADLLRVAAYADGRERVAELDCLLLADLLWHAPEDRPDIAAWLLERVCRREEDARARFLLRGVVRRACVAERAGEGDPDLAQDVQSLVRIGEERLADVMRLQGEGAALLEGHLWISREDAQRAATSLAPRVASGLEEARRYLKDVVTLQVLVESGASTGAISSMAPELWNDFIRNADAADVKSLGTRPRPGATRAAKAGG